MRDIVALFTVGIGYWLCVVPRARREIRVWERRARSIPETTLRALALAKLTRERLNPEAAACFSVLAPRKQQTWCIRLIVAYQLVYDYLDAVNEQPAYTPLADGRRLHRALTDALTPMKFGVSAPSVSYYRHHRADEDGGYVPAYVSTCRSTLRRLPAVRLAPQLAAAGERCGEAQSRNHATVADGHPQLIAWAVTQALDNEYLWWELAAAGISCLGIHALLAATADPHTSAREAACIDTAYFPSICAISALLDSLVDYPDDTGTDNHSFVAHYTSNTHAATRFAAILADATAHLAGLRHSHRHAVILAGIASYYLSAGQANTAFSKPITRRTLRAVGVLASPTLATMRLRRRMHATAHIAETARLLVSLGSFSKP